MAIPLSTRATTSLAYSSGTLPVVEPAFLFNLTSRKFDGTFFVIGSHGCGYSFLQWIDVSSKHWSLVRFNEDRGNPRHPGQFPNLLRRYQVHAGRPALTLPFPEARSAIYHVSFSLPAKSSLRRSKSKALKVSLPTSPTRSLPAFLRPMPGRLAGTAVVRWHAHTLKAHAT